MKKKLIRFLRWVADKIDPPPARTKTRMVCVRSGTSEMLGTPFRVLPGSKDYPCTVCGVLVHVAPDSAAMMEWAEPVCVECMEKEEPDFHKMMETVKKLKESADVMRALKLSPKGREDAYLN